jgi:hypothetical protein
MTEAAPGDCVEVDVYSIMCESGALVFLEGELSVQRGNPGTDERISTRIMSSYVREDVCGLSHMALGGCGV